MGRLFLFWLLIVAVSAKPDPQHLTEQYQYQRSYSQQQSGHSAGYSGDFQHLTSNNSPWIQQHQAEVRRMGDKLRAEYNAAVSSGGSGATHFQRFVSRSGPDCDQTFTFGASSQQQLDSMTKAMTQQLMEELRSGKWTYSQFHQPQFFYNRAAEKLQEASQAVPVVGGHQYYKKVVESSEQQPPVVASQGHSRIREEYRRTYQPPPPPPVQSHYSRHYEEERRVVPPTPVQTSSHYSKQFEERRVVPPAPIHTSDKYIKRVEEERRVAPQPIQASSQYSKRIEEERQVAPQPIQTSSQYSKRVEEERRVAPRPIQTSSHYSKRVEEERRVAPRPVQTSSHYSKHVEEERRVAPRPIQTSSHYSKKIEEERRVVPPTPVTYHEIKNFTSQSQTSDIPIRSNSYFSSSLAERHRQHGYPRAFSNQYQKKVEEQHVDRPQVVTSHHSHNKEEYERNQQTVQTGSSTHTRTESLTRKIYPNWCRNQNDKFIFEQYYRQRVNPTEYGRKLSREETVEFEEYYSSQGGSTVHKRKEDIRYTHPAWITTQADKVIFEEYFERKFGNNHHVLTQAEEEEFEEYFRQHGGTATHERKQTVYPSWVVTTEERKVFDEYYRAKVGQTQRQLTQNELHEFEDYYRQRQTAERQAILRQTYNLRYPVWCLTETDKRIFEEYYFSHVDAREYGRELSRNERVNFESYYTQNGGSTQHEIETAEIRLVYPAWIVTTEDKAIYEEYYMSVVGQEQYGRALTHEEEERFNEYYRSHGQNNLRSKITYPAWLVTDIDRVIYEEYYRITVATPEWGRELNTYELESFYKYYQQRGGKSREVMEASLFARLSYPDWIASEADRSLFREFYLRRVDEAEYGRDLTEIEIQQFREYYVRHRYGKWEMINGQIDYQWVYPTWITSKADRRLFDTYYEEIVEREDWGRELNEAEKVEFQQFYIEKGGLYEYRYSREEYLLAFTLNRSSGGCAYQWTWDGYERISDKKLQEKINSGDAHNTDDYDRKSYGTTKEDEPPAPTNNDNVIRPQKSTISKDRGDQPPQVYEEVEAEPGVGEYVPPDDVEVLPTVRPMEPGPRPEPPAQTYIAEPSGGTTEYRRRYEHKIVSSRVVPGGAPVTGNVDVVGVGGEGEHEYNSNNIGNNQYEHETNYHNQAGSHHVEESNAHDHDQEWSETENPEAPEMNEINEDEERERLEEERREAERIEEERRVEEEERYLEEQRRQRLEEERHLFEKQEAERTEVEKAEEERREAERVEEELRLENERREAERVEEERREAEIIEEERYEEERKQEEIRRQEEIREQERRYQEKLESQERIRAEQEQQRRQEEDQRRQEEQRRMEEEQRHLEEERHEDPELHERHEEHERHDEHERNEEQERHEGQEEHEEEEEEEETDERHEDGQEDEEEEEEYEELPPEDYINDQRRHNRRSHKEERVVHPIETIAVVQEIPATEVTTEKPGIWHKLKSKAKAILG